ncbi:MAG TPA: hypothetical protein VGS41_08510, partial [Chthonomonadales bacterium]|nr:hypothetical protein [Chthonomonadales bacterium]
MKLRISLSSFCLPINEVTNAATVQFYCVLQCYMSIQDARSLGREAQEALRKRAVEAHVVAGM